VSHIESNVGQVVVEAVEDLLMVGVVHLVGGQGVVGVHVQELPVCSSRHTNNSS